MPLFQRRWKNIVRFDVGNRKAVLCAVLLAGCICSQLGVIAHQIAKLPDVGRRDKATVEQIVLEHDGNPFCVPLVSFLAFDCLDVLRVS